MCAVSQLESVEGQRNSLLSECELLRRSLEELRAQSKPSTEPPTTAERTANQHTYLSAEHAGSPGNLMAQANGSASPGANERMSDCADGETPNRTGDSCANGEVLNNAGDPGADVEISHRTGNPSEVTNDCIREGSQNGGSRPVSPDQSDR